MFGSPCNGTYKYLEVDNVQSKGGIMSDVGLNKGQMDYARVLQVPYFGGMFSILDWKDLVGSRMPPNR